MLTRPCATHPDSHTVCPEVDGIAALEAGGQSLHARLVHRADAEGVSLNTLAVALLAAGMGDSDG